MIHQIAPEQRKQLLAHMAVDKGALHKDRTRYRLHRQLVERENIELPLNEDLISGQRACAFHVLRTDSLHCIDRQSPRAHTPHA